MAQSTTTPAEAVKAIDRQELKDKIERRESFVLLETLSPEQFQHVHVPGARNTPPDRVKELAPVVIPNKQTEVVTYCAGPTRKASADAARQLAALGYANVGHYAGRKQEWTAAALRVRTRCVIAPCEGFRFWWSGSRLHRISRSDPGANVSRGEESLWQKNRAR